jgi:hypothetical protein
MAVDRSAMRLYISDTSLDKIIYLEYHTVSSLPTHGYVEPAKTIRRAPEASTVTEVPT